MTTSIQLDSQTVRVLAEHAAALGLSVEDYLKKHFPPDNGSAPIEDADRWLDELAEGLSDLTPLPRDFSTTDIYPDRD